jgi:hypothetical protein
VFVKIWQYRKKINSQITFNSYIFTITRNLLLNELRSRLNNEKTWEKLKVPVADTGRGGSPPALVKLNDGRLALAYIYLSQFGSRVNIRFSEDKGRSWSDEIILRCCDGATFDVGYPRMVQRADGKLVLIYYWNNAKQEGAKPYRYIASTIFDPQPLEMTGIYFQEKQKY